MRKLITNDETSCTGCNRCIRSCPIEGANIAYNNGDKIKVKVNSERCIACGACINVCRHNVRDYEDDTERFINDLKNGVSISMFAAPANRTNGIDGTKLLAWLKKLGVKKIYDVSLGADICTWAHIRFIQKEHPVSVITQPCPAIVNYILLHKHGLVKYLSPVHSPMLCTAVYMKKYECVNDKIAALSPCIAKSHEFEATNYVSYNVTLKKLYEYIEKHNIQLPNESAEFDHIDSALGRLYSMPGGLKENVEFYLGKALRIDQSEGQNVVYKALDEFSEQNDSYLPAVFDVLNCPEGCNIGTGCIHQRDRFEVNAIMDKGRKDVLNDRDREYYDKMYEKYDNTLKLDDFIRIYAPVEIAQYTVNNQQIEQAFSDLGKCSEIQRTFDCAACGSDTCQDMARKVALGINVPENCIQKVREDISMQHEKVLNIQSSNLENIDKILTDVTDIKSLSDEIVSIIKEVNDAIDRYDKMSKDIDSIASHINLISLNASIEAARAGEHGKTFAVVAEQIRRLSKNTKKTVSNAEMISDQATDSVTSINGKIKDITDAIEFAYTDISNINQRTKEVLKNKNTIYK